MDRGSWRGAWLSTGGTLLSVVMVPNLIGINTFYILLTSVKTQRTWIPKMLNVLFRR